MTGLEALNKFVNIFAEYCVKTQHQEMNAINMQTAFEYLARSEECRTIEKSLKALEIIKEKYPNVVEVKLCKNYEHYKLRMSGKHDTEIVKIDWNDKSLLDYLLLLTEKEFYTLKEVLE